MAWVTAVPLAWARQREYGSAAGRDGAESQTVAGEGRLGAAPRASGESTGSFHRAGESRHCFHLTWRAGSKRLAGHVFQHAEPFCERHWLTVVSPVCVTMRELPRASES